MRATRRCISAFAHFRAEFFPATQSAPVRNPSSFQRYALQIHQSVFRRFREVGRLFLRQADGLRLKQASPSSAPGTCKEYSSAAAFDSRLPHDLPCSPPTRRSMAATLRTDQTALWRRHFGNQKSFRPDDIAPFPHCIPICIRRPAKAPARWAKPMWRLFEPHFHRRLLANRLLFSRGTALIP